MKMITYILLSLVLGLHVAKATNQIAERVDYEGEAWTLYVSYSTQPMADLYFPFESYLRSNQSTFRSYLTSAVHQQGTNSFPRFMISTACRRGYIAKWKIDDDKLFLVEIRDMDESSTYTYPLSLFSSSWKSPVFAYWVTQNVLLTTRERRNGVVLDGYARIRELQIEHGVIKAATDKNPLFGLSKPEIILNEKMREMKAVIPVPDAFKPPFSEDAVKAFFDKIHRFQRGMSPEEVEAALGKPDETRTWEPELTSKEELYSKGYKMKDVAAYLEQEKCNRINLCRYTMRYYLYKEQQGQLDIKDVHVTFEFRFDHYPDKSTRSLKQVW